MIVSSCFAREHKVASKSKNNRLSDTKALRVSVIPNHHDNAESPVDSLKTDLETIPSQIPERHHFLSVSAMEACTSHR